MRVVLVIPKFPRISETFLANKFTQLVARGHDVHVVCDAIDRRMWKEFGLPAVVRKRVHQAWLHRPRWLAATLVPVVLLIGVFRHPLATFRYLKAGFRLFGFFVFRRFYLDSEIVFLRPNILHFEFGALAARRMYLKELVGCKIIVSFRGYDISYAGLPDPTFYREVWKKADALHLLGEGLLKRARIRGCPDQMPYALIPPALDLSFFSPPQSKEYAVAGTAERPLRILSVGRLIWVKGYDYSLEAVKLLREKGIHFEYRIVGDGDSFDAVAFAVHQLGLRENVVLLGSRPPHEVRTQIEWADVFLHAAVSEGFCNAVLEAQAMELPIVSSDADGLSENVLNGETGFIVPRRNATALAEKLLQLAHEPALRKRMGMAGIRRVADHFGLQQQVSAFFCLYQQIYEDRFRAGRKSLQNEPRV
jgi:colanic acid/amylovoran biosynthesis glycosyltransferase